MRAVAVLRQPARQLAGGGGFAGTLQTDDQEDAGRLVGEAQLGFVAAQNLDQLFVNDLDHLLGGRKRMSTSSPMAFCLMFSMSCLTTRKLTSASSSAMRISRSAALHVFGRELTFAAQVLENPLQFFG